MQTFKCTDRLLSLLAWLHACWTQPDPVDNGKLHYDQYSVLIILPLFKARCADCSRTGEAADPAGRARNLPP